MKYYNIENYILELNALLRRYGTDAYKMRLEKFKEWAAEKEIDLCSATIPQNIENYLKTGKDLKRRPKDGYLNFEHYFAYKSSSQNKVYITFQPYGFNEEQQNKTKELFESMGLSVDISKEKSWHNYGLTTLMVVTYEGDKA